MRESRVDTFALLNRIERYRLAGRIAFISFAALLALFVKRPAHDDYESIRPQAPKARHVITTPACTDSDRSLCNPHVS